MIRLPYAKIENATDPEHETLSSVYFDKQHSRLVATDGIILVAIPVESEDEDVSGCISPQAITIARKIHGTLRLHEKEIIIESKQGTFHCQRSGEYPSIESVLSQIDSGKDQAVISLDAKRLLRLTKALLDPAAWECGVTLHIRGETEPILVNPYVGCLHRKACRHNRFGVIMPMERE